MSTLSLDISGLKKRVDSMLRKAEDAAGLSVNALMEPVMRQIVENVPVDTHRLQRGYAMAANQAGLGPYPVPSVTTSKYRDKVIGEMAAQIDRFEKSVAYWKGVLQNRYISKGREGKWKRDAEKKVRMYEGRLRKAQIQAAKFGFSPEAIAIYRSSKTGLTVTARDKVYGGTGKRVKVPGFNGVEIHNLEPHASIVESYDHTVREAFASARGSGLVRFQNTYLKRIGYIG